MWFPATARLLTTGTGAMLCCPMPSPSCPAELSPKHSTVVSMSRTHELCRLALNDVTKGIASAFPGAL
jgi:hypothetical protein